MFPIFKKELSGFLYSLIAYIVIGVFLVGVGLPVWVFPETSVIESGYADLSVLFSLAPYVFMFLIPAITMRSFAEEKKMGTLELLFTKPLTDWQIILGKYLASFVLMAFAVLPTIVYYFSVRQLGNPVGNIDTPGVIGSYVGLILLGGVFCSIGIFASAISTNQIVSFLMAALLCFVIYYGFDSLAQLSFFGNAALMVKQFGILYHYDSLGKGLIDSRDVVYFFSVVGLMLVFTKTALSSRFSDLTGLSAFRLRDLLGLNVVGDWLLLFNSLMAIVIINQLASFYFFRIDLTEEGRYTIKPQTVELLKDLDDDVYVEVFLEGDLNPGFTRVRNFTREMLEEFRVYSNNKIKYTFTNPETAASQTARNEFISSLAQKGINPLNVVDNRNGQRSEKLVFPGALISYGGFETGVTFLKGSTGRGNPQEVLNQAIEDVEFELANAIQKLVATQQIKIGWVIGHGELDSLQTASVVSAMLEQYQVIKLNLSETKLMDAYDLLIIAKPTSKFSLSDLYKLDQYIMKRGKVIFFIDRLDASMEHASDENYFAVPYDINLDDMLFRYGVRINPDLVQDVSSVKYPVVTGQANGRPQITPIEWPFFPLVNHYSNHPATRNLDASVFKFVSSMDTIKSAGIKKTPLIFTSQYSRVLAAPVSVSAASLRAELKPENFQAGPKPLGYLLEGSFPSLFKNRFKPEGVDEKGFKESSLPTKLIVISDGDLVRNEINSQTGEPSPLGYDPVFNVTFANKDLVLNLVSYLINENGIINARSKEIKIRPLDKNKILVDKVYWQAVNLVMPVLIIIGIGIFLNYWRNRKYSSKFSNTKLINVPMNRQPIND